MRSLTSTTRRGALALAALALGAPAAAQMPCPEGVISYVFVDNHSIFDPDDLSDERRLAWGRIANALHVRTREDFFRAELLFGEGECYDESLLAESERILRLYPFIAAVDVYGIRQSDGSWHVLVDTRDEWTTKLGLSVSLPGGLRFRGLNVTEENLLGRGIAVGVFLREQEERRDLGAEVRTARFLGTRTNLRLSAGRTRIGRFFEQGLYYPFVGEVGRLAARQAYQRRTEFFPYSLGIRRPEEGDATHILLPFEDERVELTLAARLGAPGNLTTFGVGISRETLEFPDFPGGVEVARSGDFGARDPAPAELAERIAGNTTPASATRLNLLVGQRNTRFVRRGGLDALAGEQDVAVGADAALTLGRSAQWLSTGDTPPDDLYGRLRLAFGGVGSSLVVVGAASLEARQVFGGAPTGGGWRDVLSEADLLVYWQPAALPSHTLFLRAEGAGGWKLDRPFQLLLGGPAGVRGYRDWDFPASERVLLSVEDRIHVDWPLPELFDLGFTVFVDAGRGWAGDTPFGLDSGWRGAVGGGLRIGFPAGSRSVIRLDAAFPLGPDTAPGDWVVRMSIGDLLGLSAGLENRQLSRSRRVTVGPDLFSRGP